MTETRKSLPELEGERVRVRLGRVEDAPAVVGYYRENLDRLRGSMPTPSEQIFDPPHWREQLLRNLDEFHADRAVKLFVFLKSNGALSGSVNLTQIARGPAQYCMLGYGIARGLEGQGHMSEAVRLGLDYAFGPLGLHRVQANYKPTNERSGRLLRKLGFVVEGYARDYLLLDGKWEDHVLTSLTNPAWKAS